MSNIFQKIKDFFNKPFPGLLSFFIKKDGSINPTIDEAMKDASSQSFWDRVGLDKITSIGLPVWAVLGLPLAAIAIRYFSESLQFVINVISQFGVVILFAVVGYFIYKSIKKK